MNTLRKYKFNVILAHIVIICLLSACYSPNYTEVVVFHGDFYERYGGPITPTGSLSSTPYMCYRGFYAHGRVYKSEDYQDNTKVNVYDNDPGNIFIDINDNWSGRLLYHKIRDIFPEKTDIKRIEKVEISLQQGKIVTVLSQTAKRGLVNFIIEIMTKAKSIRTQAVNTGYLAAGITIYYSDYPAADHSVLLMEPQNTKTNEWGLYFSRTEMNNSLLGGYNHVALIPDSLARELGLNQ